MSNENLPAISEENAAEAAENLRKWDAGEVVWSADMGGMGPGYEQAIQILTMETVREALANRPTTQDGWSKCRDNAVARTRENGYSGAQAGAAKGLAYQLCVNGWEKSLNHPSLEKDRKIMVSKTWPKA